jgi:phosphoribosylanthranilate isomerase
MVLVKICGLTSESDVVEVIRAGADRVGFVVVPRSPRFVDNAKAQKLIRLAESEGAEPWVVAAIGSGADHGQRDSLDRLVSETPEIAAVQLHGKETPREIKGFAARHKLTPVVKAMGISSRRDLEDAEAYEAADAFLFDAKPPKGADREGGHGRSFDWSILKGFRVHDHEDWTLSGGLTVENVAQAVRISGAHAVDVSSGVEAKPGVKDAAKVAAFIKAAKSAQ